MLAVFLTQLGLARDVAPETMDAYMICRVLAQDRAEANKVRPLASGNFFRRCINGAKAKTFQSCVALATAPLQYAAGGTRSAEAMHKAALVNLHVRPMAGLHKCDVSNAHQEYERIEAAEAMKALVPELLPWVAGELSLRTSHYYIGPSGAPLKLSKDRGGDQGDPSTGLIYMLTYHRVVMKTEEAAKVQDPDAKAYAYQDDMDMIALPGAAKTASETYLAECARVGLRANRSKETWTPGRDVSVAEHPEGIRITGRATVLKHGGGGSFEAPVTTSSGHAPGSQLTADSPELVKLKAERQRVLQRIRQLRVEGGLHKQLAMNLLRVKTGSDATFLARARGIPETMAQELDQALVHTIIELSGLPEDQWDTKARQRIFIPTSEGSLVSAVGSGQGLLPWQPHGRPTWNTLL